MLKYFEQQTNILVLHRLMSEPVISLTRKYDSFDMIVEMKINELLNSPTVVEVLNLVYEGKYSAS